MSSVWIIADEDNWCSICLSPYEVIWPTELSPFFTLPLTANHSRQSSDLGMERQNGDQEWNHTMFSHE